MFWKEIVSLFFWNSKTFLNWGHRTFRSDQILPERLSTLQHTLEYGELRLLLSVFWRTRALIAPNVRDRQIARHVSPHTRLNWCSRWHGKINGYLLEVQRRQKSSTQQHHMVMFPGMDEVCVCTCICVWAGIRCVNIVLIAVDSNLHEDPHPPRPQWMMDTWGLGDVWVLFCGMWVWSLSASFFSFTLTGHKSILTTQQWQKWKAGEKAVTVDPSRSLDVVHSRQGCFRRAGGEPMLIKKKIKKKLIWSA